YFIGLVHDTNMMSTITLGLTITIVFMAIGNLFGVGGGTFITRLLGSGDKEKGKKIAGYSFYMSLTIGLLIGLVSLFFLRPIAHLLGADAATLTYTKEYAAVLLGGGFSMILNYGLEQLVRAEGASKESMYG
ncbi:MATE family efflux transporter, partial [Bradyrhizobium sp. BRP05]|nr:MATE family efflux transporter [Bradyrhizobium sp. BRP05]